jgi:hypothetical protein
LADLKCEVGRNLLIWIERIIRGSQNLHPAETTNIISSIILGVKQKALFLKRLGYKERLPI